MNSAALERIIVQLRDSADAQFQLIGEELRAIFEDPDFADKEVEEALRRLSGLRAAVEWAHANLVSERRYCPTRNATAIRWN